MWYTCFTSFKYTFAKQKFLYLAPLQMARTRQTSRKSIEGRAYARRTPVEPAPAPAPPSPAPAQSEEEDKEVPGRDYFFVEDQDGRIMEVYEEGNLRSPLSSPTPAQEDPVPPTEDPVPAPDEGDY